MKGDNWSNAEIIISALTIAVAGFWIGVVAQRHFAIKEAIQVGVAHYTVDPRTGVTQFEWVTNRSEIKQ